MSDPEILRISEPGEPEVIRLTPENHIPYLRIAEIAGGGGGGGGEQGPPGPQGPQGPAGPQGPQGLKGDTGNTGADGAAGATGPQGPIGLTGPQGPIGNTGPQGPQGLKGDTGNTGADGAAGATGPQGPIGLTGPQGPQGVKGDTGNTGPQGPIGLTGPQGPAGADGADGESVGGNWNISILDARQQTFNVQIPNPTSTEFIFTDLNYDFPVLTGVADVKLTIRLAVNIVNGGNELWVRLGSSTDRLTNPVIVNDVLGDEASLKLVYTKLFKNLDLTTAKYLSVSMRNWSDVFGSLILGHNNGGSPSDTSQPFISGVIIEIMEPGASGAGGSLQGPAGPTGPAGPQGPQGPIGNTGPTGPAGADGAQGPQGPIGLTGNTGPQGPIGNTGAQGPQGIQGLTGPQGAQGNGYTPIILTTTVASSATANALLPVSALNWTTVAGKLMHFRYVFRYTANATTTGSRWTINSATAATTLTYSSYYTLTATSRTFNEGLTAYNLPAASNASSIVAGNTAVVEGWIQTATAATVSAQFASEIAGAGFITVQPGSFVEYKQVIL